MTRHLRRGSLAAALLLALASPVAAHDPGLSFLDVTVTRESVVSDLSLSNADAAVAGNLGDFALATIHVRIDERDLHGAVELIGPEGSDGVRVRVVYARANGSKLLVRSGVPHRLARGHRQLLSIRDEGGRLIAERMLDSHGIELTVDLGASARSKRTAPWPFSPGAALIAVLLGSTWLFRGSRRPAYPLSRRTRHSVSASDSPSHGSGT
jgi:hypothetical protein